MLQIIKRDVDHVNKQLLIKQNKSPISEIIKPINKVLDVNSNYSPSVKIKDWSQSKRKPTNNCGDSSVQLNSHNGWGKKTTGWG